MVVASVAVAIFQTANASGCLGRRVVVHLGYVEPAVFVPGDGDWACQLGFGRNQLDREIGVGEHERLHRLGWRSWTVCSAGDLCEERYNQEHQAGWK